MFESQAGDLGPTDGNGGLWDVYLRDLTTGTTSPVSVEVDGSGAANSLSSDPVFSPDGRRLAFTSTADDLVPKDTARPPTHTAPIESSDLFVRHLATRARRPS